MSKTEDVSMDSIDSQEPNKDIEYVKQDTIDIPDYRYGESNEQLDYNVALRNKPVA
jgi:hypothetical protein